MWCVLHRGLQNGGIGAQHFMAVLREVADADLVPQFTRAGTRLQRAREQLQQRRLPRAVGSDQHRLLPPLRLKLQPAVHHQIAVGKVHVGERHHPLAGTLRLRKPKLTHRPFRGLGRLDFLHPVDLLELALRLRRLACLGAEAVRKGLQRLDFPLLIFVGGQLLFGTRILLPEVILVIATVPVEAASADLHNGTHELVEEFAVVRNDEDRTAIRAKVFLKPAQRFEIKMVGGFVEQQQVGFLHEQSGQVRAHHPAAAQGTRRPLEIGFAKGESLEDLFGARLELPAVVVRKHLKRGVVFRRVIGGCGKHLEGFRHPRGNGTGQLQDRLVAHRRALLRKVAVIRAALPNDVTGVGLLAPEDHREQGRLPGSVGADKADPVPAVELQGRLLKKDAAMKRFGDLGKREHERLLCAPMRAGAQPRTVRGLHGHLHQIVQAARMLPCHEQARQRRRDVRQKISASPFVP